MTPLRPCWRKILWERLLQSYEGAVRRWVQVQGSFELVGHMSEDVRKASQAEYIAA
jgi:hypothetical protein